MFFECGIRVVNTPAATTNSVAELALTMVLASTRDVVKGTYAVDKAGAFYNYAGIVDDRSSGVHNYDYIHALLVNSIAKF